MEVIIKDNIVKKLEKLILAAEIDNIRSKKSTDFEMIRKIKKMIEEEVDAIKVD